MALVLYGKNEPGYTELDYDALTNEQAVAIGDLIHRIALDFSDIREVAVFSTRVTKALSWIEPKLVTVMDLKCKPRESWKTHAFMDKHIYEEIRETMRPFLGNQRLPAWELLP
jgi:hypothetical protein